MTQYVITEVVVSAGRVVNHPYESYSNLKPNLTLKAMIPEGVDVEEAIKALQAKAERMIEDHKDALLKSIEDIYNMRQAERELASLETQLIYNTQGRIEALRKKLPEQQPLLEPLESE